MKCLKKRDDYYRSGNKAGKIPTCKCFNDLLFLKDSVNNKTKTVSNIKIVEKSPNVNNNTSNNNKTPTMSNSSTPNESTCNTSNDSLANYENTPRSLKAINNDDSANLSKLSAKKRQSTKRKAEERRDDIDTLLIKTLSKCDDAPVTKQENESSDMLFCKSLVPIMESLRKKKNRKARLEIQRILMELESDESD